MSSLTSHPPFEVANLCSNCQNVRFRDDIPQLYQSGPHVDLYREQLPKDRQGRRTGGILPTEFELTDSYPELPELRKSAQAGCDFCRFLHGIIVSFVSEDLDINKLSGCIMAIYIDYSWAMRYPDGDDGTYDSLNGLDSMLITAEFWSDEIGDNEITRRVVCHLESACDSDAVSRWLRLSNRSNQQYCDADSVRWMRQTLETCEKIHSHDVFDHAYIPERIIDVRPAIPRLTLRGDHMQSNCASTLKYAALSYCWGSGENQAKTTVATLSSRQAGIAETELSPVIQDAIKVTRALGIPFLWVDALCIMQDDPSDWGRQCTEMHNIYGSAQVTLCAANSRSCGEGFLRQTGGIIRVPFQSHREPNTEGSFLIQDKGLTHRFKYALTSASLYFDQDSSRWGSRGWVFQEELLSTRRLIFGARDLHFLCSGSHQRRGQDAIPRGYDSHIGKSEIEGDLNDIYETWEHILNSYSAYGMGSFTNATDVLPALSGLARLFHGRLRDEYYAGHWRRNLYRSLLWGQGGSHTHDDPFWPDSFSRLRSEAFIVPSWSGLNKGRTEGSIQHLHFHDAMGKGCDCRSEIHLLKAKVLISGANPFGALTGCTLRLRGYTLDLSHKEVVARVSWDEGDIRELYSFEIYGRRFGTLNFDCKPKLHDEGGKCVSKGKLGQFKLLLLMWCDYRAYEVTPSSSGSEGELSSEESSSEEGCGEREYREIEGSIETIPGKQQEECGGLDSWEDRGRKEEQMCGEEASAPTDESSDDSQSQRIRRSRSPASIYLRPGNTVRKGFGLIICPTGNDGEFYRVGVFRPASTWRTTIGIDGDIRDLQNLAQVETVQLV